MNENGSSGKSRVASKKQLRRERKRDQKNRKLAESVERIFMDDLADLRAQYYDDEDEKIVTDINDDTENTLFSEQIKNDPELAEELRAVERKLAEVYPDKDEGEECNERMADAAV